MLKWALKAPFHVVRGGVEREDSVHSASPLVHPPSPPLRLASPAHTKSRKNSQRVPHLVLLISQRQVLVVHLHHQLLHLPLQPAVAQLEAGPVPGRTEPEIVSSQSHRQPAPGSLVDAGLGSGRLTAVQEESAAQGTDEEAGALRRGATLPAAAGQTRPGVTRKGRGSQTAVSIQG